MLLSMSNKFGQRNLSDRGSNRDGAWDCMIAETLIVMLSILLLPFHIKEVLDTVQTVI